MSECVVTFDPRPVVGPGAMDALHAEAIEEDKARDFVARHFPLTSDL